MCSYLLGQQDFLEQHERSRDSQEQDLLHQSTIGISNSTRADETEMQDHNTDADLNDRHQTSSREFESAEGSEWSAELVDDDDDEEIHADAEAEADAEAAPRPDASRPRHDALQNSYVRAVHTNGIHDLPLITCQCRRANTVAEDLAACRLLPASFSNIRTVFSMEVLDHFRLCNLELKASAYQFYQLLRRLTRPMEPAQAVNLYDEFRRMSRIWRWMKKLKWAGYGHKRGDPMNVEAGKLANYCAACPQPGINLPERWKDDKNR